MLVCCLIAICRAEGLPFPDNFFSSAIHSIGKLMMNCGARHAKGRSASGGKITPIFQTKGGGYNKFSLSAGACEIYEKLKKVSDPFTKKL